MGAKMRARGGAAKAKLNTAPHWDADGNIVYGGKSSSGGQSPGGELAKSTSGRSPGVKSIKTPGSTAGNEHGWDFPDPDVEVEGGQGENKAPMINLKRTIADLERWPRVVEGYIGLVSYFCFFMLFVLLVMFQLDVTSSNKIDNVVRNNLLDQDGALANVQTHGDVFDYLLKDFNSDTEEWEDGEDGDVGGVLGQLFANNHYNGDPITSDDRGFLYDYNKLIGGVLILQQRGEIEACTGMYWRFYPDCYNDTLIEAKPPKSKINSSQYNESDPEYQAALNRSKFGDRSVLEDDANGYSEIRESFQYDYTKGGYAVFLSLAKGTEQNFQKIKDLKTMRWLDKSTRSLAIKFTFYNGNYGKFAYAATTMTFHTAGLYKLYDPESAAVSRIQPGGTTVNIGTLNMEPYLTEGDFIRLGFEVIFMIWVFWLTASYVRAMITAAIRFRLRAFFNHWAILDGINYACFVIFIAFRVTIIQMILDNAVEVPVNEYKVIFEDVDALTRSQLTVNFLSILLCIFRFFKYYEFQPRLQIVNKTMAASVVHLYHFMVIFLVIFIGFSAVGYLNFGTSSRDFSTLGYAMMAMFESLFGNFDLGPTIGNGNLAYINAIMGPIFFITWIFVSVMVLFNVFVAILMDGYASAKEEGQAEAVKAGKNQPDAVSDDVIQFLFKTVQSMDRRTWKYTDTTLLHALKQMDDAIEDPPLPTEKMNKELKKLKAKEEEIQSRIRYLEKMTDDEIPDLPFHPFWNRKAVSMEELAHVVPQIHRELQGNLDQDEMAEIWQDTLRLVPENDEGDQDAEDGAEVKMEELKTYLAQLVNENAKMRAKLRG